MIDYGFGPDLDANAVYPSGIDEQVSGVMGAKWLQTFSLFAHGFAVCCAALLSGAAMAQSEDPVGEQLSSSRDVNLFYSEQRDRFWRDNAEKLAAIDREYRDAIEALSAENVERIRAISGSSATQHKALADDGLKGSERSAASARIQSEAASARAELQGWYAAERKAISDRHAERRAAQIAENKALIEALSVQQKETLQRVIDAPVALTTLDRFSGERRCTGSARYPRRRARIVSGRWRGRERRRSQSAGRRGSCSATSGRRAATGKAAAGARLRVGRVSGLRRLGPGSAAHAMRSIRFR